MTDRTIRDLVGRAMIDREFLADLVRDPEGMLAGYELTAEERAVIVQALGRMPPGSEQERGKFLENVLLKRWAV
jgi:hypothetical protein